VLDYIEGQGQVLAYYVNELRSRKWLINKLRKTYKRGGRKAVGLALEKLAKDPIRFVVVIGALYPDMMREMIRDQMAEAGITEQDLRELIQKLESTPGTKH